jgi:hypothetical protein
MHILPGTTIKCFNLCGLVFLAVLLAACGVEPLQGMEIPAQSIALNEQQMVLVEVDAGEVVVYQSASGMLEIGGVENVPAEVDFHVEQSAAEVRVVAHYTRRWFLQPVERPVRLVLKVPPGCTLKIETFSAAVDLDGLTGTVDVSSVAGVISARDLEGTVSLKSNRGAVTLADSHGELHVLGNYGLLALADVRGMVNAATIMGTIQFSGLVAAGDDVHLETDHGAVDIRLASTSDLDLQIRSTSGNMTCLWPGLQLSSRSCVGTIGSGVGRLTVRTVSGAVTFQPEP